MSIESNIAAGKKAREVIDLVTSEGVGLEDPARYFRELHRMLAEIINEPAPERRATADAMTIEEARAWERKPMPFGTHQDKPISDVPIDYLLFIDGDDFRRQLGRYLRSEAVQREQG